MGPTYRRHKDCAPRVTLTSLWYGGGARCVVGAHIGRLPFQSVLACRRRVVVGTAPSLRSGAGETAAVVFTHHDLCSRTSPLLRRPAPAGTVALETACRDCVRLQNVRLRCGEVARHQVTLLELSGPQPSPEGRKLAREVDLVIRGGATTWVARKNRTTFMGAYQEITVVQCDELVPGSRAGFQTVLDVLSTPRLRPPDRRVPSPSYFIDLGQDISGFNFAMLSDLKETRAGAGEVENTCLERRRQLPRS